MSITSTRTATLATVARDIAAIRLAVGVAEYPEPASDTDGLYMAADAALADAIEGDKPLSIAI